MAKSRNINILFPHGGENRRMGYEQNRPPYFSQRMTNVRSVGSLETRQRGGTRPGLTKYIDNYFGTNITGIHKVTYLDDDGVLKNDLAVIADGLLHICEDVSVETTTAFLTDDDGNKIITDDDDYIIYGSTVASVSPLGNTNAFQMAEKDGRLYIADSTLKEYDPKTGLVRDITEAPASQPLVCIYQERLVLSGENHLFYMSEQDDISNWNFAKDEGNVGQAIAGHVGNDGAVGEQINSMFPWKDKALVFGTNSTLAVIYGNIAGGGEKKSVSHNVGILGPRAITVTPDGLIVFVAREGVYTWRIGSDKDPEPFSEYRVPEELLNIDTTVTDVNLAYDHRSKGVHLFLTAI